MEQERDQAQQPGLMEVVSWEPMQGAGAESGAWPDGPRQLGARAGVGSGTGAEDGA